MYTHNRGHDTVWGCGHSLSLQLGPGLAPTLQFSGLSLLLSLTHALFLSLSISLVFSLSRSLSLSLSHCRSVCRFLAHAHSLPLSLSLDLYFSLSLSLSPSLSISFFLALSRSGTISLARSRSRSLSCARALSLCLCLPCLLSVNISLFSFWIVVWSVCVYAKKICVRIFLQIVFSPPLFLPYTPIQTGRCLLRLFLLPFLFPNVSLSTPHSPLSPSFSLFLSFPHLSPPSPLLTPRHPTAQPHEGIINVFVLESEEMEKNEHAQTHMTICEYMYIHIRTHSLCHAQHNDHYCFHSNAGDVCQT